MSSIKVKDRKKGTHKEHGGKIEQSIYAVKNSTTFCTCTHNVELHFTRKIKMWFWRELLFVNIY